MAYYLRRRNSKAKDAPKGAKQGWQAIHHRTENGHRVTRSKTFATKREAEQWATAEDYRYHRNPHASLSQGKTLFAELVDQWEAVLYPKLAPKSQARYEQVVRTHLLPEFENAPVNTINRQWIRRYLAGLQAQTKPDGQPRYAPGTVHKVLTTLSSIMSEAVEAEMVEANPCRDVRSKLLRKEHRKLIPLSPSEVEALAEQIARKHAPYGTLVRIAAYTGLRAGELHALRKRDVNLIAGELTVARAIKEWRDGEPVYGTTKSEERRTVALSQELVDLLAAHIPATAHPDDLVFTAMRSNTAIHQVAFLRNHFKPARQAALPDHPNLRFHDLRHTFCSMLIAQGVNVKEIAAQAGHKSAAMTLDVYGHLYPTGKDSVKQAQSAALASATPTVIPLRKTEDVA